jgi:hypothetical protein
LDRKRRDLSSSSSSRTDSDEKFEQIETETTHESAIEKRSSSREISSSVDEVSELLEGSENNDDVQRRTRQLRPSIISSPWRISSARAVNFAPSQQNSFGSNFNGFPSATSGFLYKSDGRFYPTNNFKSSQQDDFSPVISTYSGNNNKHKFSSNSNFQSFGGGFGGGDSSEREQESTPKYKQSSKIPSHSSSSALLPLLYSLESFEPKSKATTPPPAESQDNYSYFHLGKSSSQQQQQQQQDKLKTYAFPVSNNQQPASTQRPFVSFNSVGGFFNNNQQSSNQGFLPHKPVQSNKAPTPAPIYEGSKSASSYDSRYTTPPPSSSSVIKNASPSFQSNPFLNNLNFNGGSQTVFNFGVENNGHKNNNGNHVKKPHEEKIVEITTKKQSYKHQYPIPTSTPKYISSFTTPNQLFDVDKFIAELRETQRLQGIQKTVIGSGGSQQQVHKNKTLSSSLFNPHNHYQIFTTPTPPTTSTVRSTTLSDEYYYDDDDEEEESTYNNGANLSKFNKYNYQTNEKHPQISQHPQPVKDSHSSFSLNKKPNLINSNAATNDDDEYYDEYEDEEEEFQFLPPPVNKPKYTPMTETMAPRPINVTTLKPYYVSGNTFSTPPSVTSTIPSIIKFPDDVFQAIRPFTSHAPKIVYSKNKPSNNLRPSGNFEITKAPAKTTVSSTITERTTTRKTKIVKIVTKPTTKKFNSAAQQVTSTTLKPSRTTRRRPNYTLNRGNSRFKASTKRPDLTRLEIDEKLPNR